MNINLFKSLTTPDYSVYQSQLNGLGSINGTLRTHTLTGTTCEVVSTLGVIDRGFNYALNPDGSGRYFFATDEKKAKLKSGNGFITTFETDPLRNATTLQGVLLTSGSSTYKDKHKYELDLTNKGVLAANLNVKYGLTVLLTRIPGLGLNNNTMQYLMTSINVDKGLSMAYSISEQYLDNYMYGSHQGGAIGVRDIDLNASFFNNIKSQLITSTGSEAVAREVPIHLSVMGTNFTTTLSAISEGSSYILEPIHDLGNNLVIGYQLGSQTVMWGTIDYSPITSTFAAWDQKMDSMYDLSLTSILQAIVTILLAQLPNWVIDYPDEYKTSIGFAILKPLIDLVPGDSGPIKHMKAQGRQWSMSYSSTLEARAAFDMPDAKAQELAKYISGSALTEKVTTNIGTLLTSGQDIKGDKVSAIVNTIEGPLTGQERQAVTQALLGGVRIV